MANVSGRIRAVGPPVVVLTLLAAVAVHRVRLAEAVDVVNTLQDMARRVDMEARLAGQQLPALAGLDLSGDSVAIRTYHPTMRAVWFLAPRECPECAEDLRQWAALARPRVLDVLIVLNGVSLREARSLLAATGASSIAVVDEASHSRYTLGLFRPSVKTLISPDGTVALVDARTGTRACDWTFEDQVRSLTAGSAPASGSAAAP